MQFFLIGSNESSFFELFFFDLQRSLKTLMKMLTWFTIELKTLLIMNNNPIMRLSLIIKSKENVYL